MIMKEVWKGNKRKAIIIGSVIILCLIAATGGIIYYVVSQDQSQDGNGRPQGMDARQSDGTITASGTTMVGKVEDSYDIDYLDDDLYIEKVYISSGGEVKAGDEILKLSDDTVSAGQKQLEKAVTEAELDYRSGVVDYNLSKIEAQETLDLSVKRGELAESTYADAISSIDQNIADIQKEMADDQEDLQEYQDAINNDAFYDKYEVGYKKEIFETNYTVFYERINEWNLSQYLETSDADYSRKQFCTGITLTADEKEKVTQLTSFLKRVYEYQDDYKAAEEEYEAAKKDAAVQIEKLQVEIESLQLELQEAQLNYEADIAAAKAVYETSLAESAAAQSTYNTAIKKLDEALESQQNDKEDAKYNLSHFEELVGDGYFRASSDGTALIVTSTEATDLTDDTMVMAYSNPDTVTVTVAIDQSNIASLTIGDQATVAIEGFDDFTGKITQIQPTSSSSSRSSVTYNVTVTLDGDVSVLDVNLIAVVTFKPVTDESGTEESTTEESTIEESDIEESATEESAADTSKEKQDDSKQVAGGTAE